MRRKNEKKLKVKTINPNPKLVGKV